MPIIQQLGVYMIENKKDDKVTFEQHPAFEKKKKRSSKYKGIKQSEVNPFNNIIEQHTEHKNRIIKIVFIIVMILSVLIIIKVASNEYTKSIEKATKLEKMNQVISLIDIQMNKADLFQKEQLATRAIIQYDKIIKYDFINRRQWIEKQDKYKQMILQSFPVLGMKKGINYIVPTILTTMKHIPKGNFTIGRRQGKGDDDELPFKKISITSEFWMSESEITNYQIKKIMPNHSSGKWGKYFLSGDSLPAVNISWQEANLFCRSLTEAEQNVNRIPKNYEYRLPTEAEWEYACRAGTETIYFWGDKFGELGAQFANTRDGRFIKLEKWNKERGIAKNDKHIVSAPVKSYAPNGFGLYDMTGNVWEWCADWYRPKAYMHISQENPLNSRPVEVVISKMRESDAERYVIPSPAKVMRGGSWGNLPSECRSAAREYAEAKDKNTGVGFRIVLAPKILNTLKQ